MGITAMIPDMTIGQLMNEAAARWGEIWDPHATRMTLLLLCPRKERKMMELHGDMIDHGQPVVSVFHRPRAEAHLLEEQGFDPRAASFMFVNIATADMGPWMQQLVNNEGWLRNSIQLASTPFSVGLPSQRPFEALQTLCFRHPSLPALEQYFLPFPAESLPGKCFVSLPRRAAAEMARQQAEVLGVGRLEKPAPPEPEPVAAPAPPPAPEPREAPVAQTAPKAEAEPQVDDVATPEEESVVADQTDVPLPPSASPEPAPPAEEASVPLPPSTTGSLEEKTAEPAESAPAEEETKALELPEVVEEAVEISEIETELRAFFQELIDAGVEPSAFMDDPRWEDISERAIAEGLETWPILLQMTAME
ncbi:MAG: hypothetical protein VXY14_08055 [Candidatus Thermoplasmatota archaeon]|nr:hypothetical protein [Candidatus Thermoplasmatota archaeon]